MKRKKIPNNLLRKKNRKYCSRRYDQKDMTKYAGEALVVPYQIQAQFHQQKRQ